MDDQLLYTLDPYIISLLFKPATDDKALEIYNELLAGVNDVLKGTLKEFLLENKFTEQEAEEVMNTEDFDTLGAKYRPYLQNIILYKRVEENTRTYLKLFYDQLLPKLSPEDKQKLDEYLKTNQENIDAQKKLTMDSLKLMKDILEENGVQNYEELEKKLSGKTSNEPSINLGGVNTTTEASSTQNVQEVVLNVVEPQIESVTLPAQPESVITQQTVEPIINPIDISNNTGIPQGGAVDMALQSAITPAETQVFDNITPTEAEPKIPEVTPVRELPNLSLDSEMPIPPAPPVAEMIMPVIKPVQVTPESNTPESTTNIDIQFTPLTEVPTSPVLDNQLPPLPETTIAEPVTTATESVPEIPLVTEPVKLVEEITPQVPLSQPTSAAAKLDVLGISLDDNTEQKV